MKSSEELTTETLLESLRINQAGQIELLKTCAGNENDLQLLVDVEKSLIAQLKNVRHEFNFNEDII